MPEVAQVDDQDRQQHHDAEREGELHDQQRHDPERLVVRGERVDGEQHEQRRQREQGVGRRARRGGDREHLAWAVHLVHEHLVGQQRVAAAVDGRREEAPRDQADVGEQRVGHVARLEGGQPLEEHGEDHHEHQRRDDRPGEAEDGLLVAGPQVPLHERAGELAVGVDLPDRAQQPDLALVDQLRRRLVGDRPRPTGPGAGGRDGGRRAGPGRRCAGRRGYGDRGRGRGGRARQRRGGGRVRAGQGRCGGGRPLAGGPGRRGGGGSPGGRCGCRCGGAAVQRRRASGRGRGRGRCGRRGRRGGGRCRCGGGRRRTGRRRGVGRWPRREAEGAAGPVGPLAGAQRRRGAGGRRALGGARARTERGRGLGGAGRAPGRGTRAAVRGLAVAAVPAAVGLAAAVRAGAIGRGIARRHLLRRGCGIRHAGSAASSARGLAGARPASGWLHCRSVSEWGWTTRTPQPGRAASNGGGPAPEAADPLEALAHPS